MMYETGKWSITKEWQSELYFPFSGYGHTSIKNISNQWYRILLCTNHYVNLERTCDNILLDTRNGSLSVRMNENKLCGIPQKCPFISQICSRGNRYLCIKEITLWSTTMYLIQIVQIMYWIFYPAMLDWSLCSLKNLCRFCNGDGIWRTIRTNAMSPCYALYGCNFPL